MNTLKSYHNEVSFFLFPFSFFLFLVVLISCHKEQYDLSSNLVIQELPEVIVEYEEVGLSEVEFVRNAIAKGLGKAISEDKVFKKEFFAMLTDSDKRAIVNIPVLKYFKENFTAGTGIEVLNDYLQQDSPDEISFRSTQDWEALVLTLEPNMTIELPKYVVSYFVTPETINKPISDFADLPMAIYPEVNHTNTQGVMVGYGDETEWNPSGLYGVYPTTSYNDQIPVHVKRSRSLVMVQNGQVHGAGVSEIDLIKRLYPNRPPACLESLAAEFSNEPAFLTNGGKYLNVAEFSKHVRSYCPPSPPSFVFEICDDGIDNDDDGLIDALDPDCFPTEICDNGIDDDGDELIDAFDPDCALTCPDDAVHYRDCENNTNRLTGAKFASVNWCQQTLNPLLPGIETQINLTLTFLRILNIQNCGTPCALNMEYTNLLKGAVSVYVHPGLLDFIEFTGQYEYFQSELDNYLDNGDISYFLIRAQSLSQGVPNGAVPVGVLGENVVGSSSNSPVVAYVVMANWVNIASTETDDDIRNDGIEYTRTGDLEPDWDASYIGDVIQMDVTLTDATTVSVTEGATSTSTQTSTRSASFTGSIGRKFGPDGNNSTNFGAGFTFGTTNVSADQTVASLQYTVSAARVQPLNTVTLRYQDVPNRVIYPRTHVPLVIGIDYIGTFTGYSYGHDRLLIPTWDRDPFSLALTGQQSNPYQLIGEGDPVQFINVIRSTE